MGAARFTRSALDKVFPDHFSFMLGELALYSFLALVGTGIYLSLFFEPSQRVVTYDGSYQPMDGLPMSAAYSSALKLSFDVRAGLVMRQAHHWAALVFLAAITAHLMRVFFTGAFRKPRDINWAIGLTLFLLALANGFAGYSLLDDLLSGTGLRVGSAIALSIPVIGPWVESLAFGGEFPTTAIISRLFVVHVLIVPLAIGALLTLHLGLVWHQKHTQFPGPGRTEDNVVGSRLWPRYAVKSVSLMLGVFGVLAALGGLAQINPVWLYGPYDPAQVTTSAQPDWYMGWLEGGLRLWPPWEVRWGPVEIPSVFFPGVLLPTLTFAVLYFWPVIERVVSGDRAAHNLLTPPRTSPIRTAVGVGALTFYSVLFLAGGQDVFAVKLGLSVDSLLIGFRVAALVVPPLAGWLTWRICRASAPRSGSAGRRDPGGDRAAPAGGAQAVPGQPVSPAMAVASSAAAASTSSASSAVRVPSQRVITTSEPSPATTASRPSDTGPR